jgi:ribonuclease P protein component
MRAFVSLRRPADFSRLRQRGRRAAMEAFTLFADPQRPLGRSVVGISVNKTVGVAVVRNRVRRRIASLLHEALSGREPQRLLVVARPAAASAPFEVLRAQLLKALG